MESSYRILFGDDAGNQQEFVLSESSSVIGRDPGVDIVIDSTVVSRQHARLYFEGGSYYIEDLNSSNGTFVNGAQVSGPVALNSGDQIRLGQAIQLSFEGPPPAASAPPASPEMTVAEGDMGDMGATLEQPAYTPTPTPTPAEPASRGDFDKTMMADSDMMSAVADSATGAKAPPRLDVAIAGQSPQSYALTKDSYTLGRADDNDIVIPSKIVSRYHARLERSGGGYQIVTLPDAGNPVLFEGRPLSGPHYLNHNDIMRIGSLDPGLMVTMSYHWAAAQAAGGAQTVDLASKELVTIGRAPDNDIVIDLPQVSRYHAQIEQVGQRYRITDLRSSNGVFVADQRIDGDAWLRAGDAFRVGPSLFVVGDHELAQYDESGGLKVTAQGLNKWVRSDLNILQDISLVIQPKEFIVVVGQSGGGKSTLIDAIAGYRPATHGSVHVNDIDVYKNFDAIRSKIGYVPQKDIIHMELSVYEALDYAAQLRMPKDTSKEERHNRIMEVLEDLDIAHRADTQISGLSGGQQKRVSIGVELLTKPDLFFLDEPTSGLDPGTETALMQLMRRLADQGRTILLITHATKNVMLADKVIFLARGGYLAWFGPPDEALQYFDQFRSDRARRVGEMEFDEIYTILEETNYTAQDWADSYKNHPAYQTYILQAQ